jgi:hypothetical protein
MILVARTCRTSRRHFRMPSTQSENCEKRSATTIWPLMMIVTDEAGQTVCPYPFFPGC